MKRIIVKDENSVYEGDLKPGALIGLEFEGKRYMVMNAGCADHFLSKTCLKGNFYLFDKPSEFEAWAKEAKQRRFTHKDNFGDCTMYVEYDNEGKATSVYPERRVQGDWEKDRPLT